jgi:hypothetical protein
MALTRHGAVVGGVSGRLPLRNERVVTAGTAVLVVAVQLGAGFLILAAASGLGA